MTTNGLTRRALIASAIAAPTLALLPKAAVADTAPVYSVGGVALDGTDVVAYFKEGRAVAGTDAHTHQWNGSTWHFSSAANRDAFAADPAAYAPLFGGYCAWAVAEGYTAKTDPDAWKIVDDKLYLNFNRRIQRRWERDVPGNIARGNANWPNVLKG